MVNNIMDLTGKVDSYIKLYRMVKPGDLVAVGVSGGPDSMALLHVLYALKEELGISLHVVHLNHMFRGNEAEQDSELVARTAGEYGLDCTSEKKDVPAYRKISRLSAQEAAREVRYRFFSEVAARTGAARVALAHHADDQAETVLLRLLRGAGPAGLKGMAPVRDLYIRPFLTLRRSEIAAYCIKRNLSFRVDASNLKRVYTRNRIRLDLLPLLEREYNPNIVPALCRLAEICREEDDFLERAALPVYREALVEEGPGRQVLSIRVLERHPLAIKRRVVRQALGSLKGGPDLSYQHLEAVLASFGKKEPGAGITLPGGVRVYRSYETLELSTKGFAPVPPYSYRLQIPGTTEVPEAGLSIKAMVLTAGTSQDPKSLPPAEAIFNFDLLPDELYVRGRIRGDVFFPLGGRGKVKLKDFLIKQKVPREKRDRLPIVATGEEIIWVGGVRPAEKWKVTPGTVRVLYLKIERALCE